MFSRMSARRVLTFPFGANDTTPEWRKTVKEWRIVVSVKILFGFGNVLSDTGF